MDSDGVVTDRPHPALPISVGKRVSFAELSTRCAFGFCSVVFGMNLKTLMRRYPTEAAARRWPRGGAVA